MEDKNIVSVKLAIPVEKIESIYVLKKRKGANSAVVRTSDRYLADEVKKTRNFEDWKVYPDSGPTQLKERYILKNIKANAPKPYTLMFWKGAPMLVNVQRKVWAPYNVWQHSKGVGPGTDLINMDQSSLDERFEWAMRAPTQCPTDLKILNEHQGSNMSSARSGGRGGSSSGVRGGRGSISADERRPDVTPQQSKMSRFSNME